MIDIGSNDGSQLLQIDLVSNHPANDARIGDGFLLIVLKTLCGFRGEPWEYHNDRVAYRGKRRDKEKEKEKEKEEKEREKKSEKRGILNQLSRPTAILKGNSNL